MSTSTRRTHYWVTFAVLSAGVMSYSLMQSLTVPVLHEIEVRLDTDQSTVTWVLTAYLLSASVFTPIVGRLGDVYGKKRLLVISLVTLAAGTLIAALATSIGVLIIARIIQGVGGGVLPLSFGIIRDEFPHHKVGSAVSIVSSILAAGFGAGIVLAGPIDSALGYHWLFWLPFIMVTLATIAAFFLVPESAVRTPGKISVLPAVLLSAWLICLLLGLSRAPEWGWGSPKVIGLLVAAIVLALVWIRVELVADVPLIDMQMMRLPGVWTTNLVAMLVGVGMYASGAFIPQFLQTPGSNGYGFGSSITESGLMMLPTAVFMFGAGAVAAPIAVRVGPKVVVIVGSVIGALGMFMLGLFHDEKWQIYVANGLTGLGIGFAFSCLAGLIVAAVKPEQTGVASGMNANIRTIGGSIGSAVVGSVVTASFLPSGFPKESSYTAAFIVLGGALLAAGLAAVVIPSISGPKLEQQLEMEPEPEHVTDDGLVRAQA